MDLDEQARPTGPEAAADQDISDEPQDFRFLQTFALYFRLPLPLPIRLTSRYQQVRPPDASASR